MIAEGGIGGTGVTMGRVSGFGSLFVNGVEFDTSSSTFVYEEDRVGDQSGIRVGMVVRITGEDDGVTGLAEIVEYASLFEGTLSTNSIASNETGSLLAMGQNVTVDADTVYDDGGTGILLSMLPPSAIIEVSGFTDGNGNILATRIEVKQQQYSGETLDVKALVSNLDSANKTFMLGSLNIDYSALELPDGITDGIYVEARGTLQNDVLIAGDVQLEDGGDLVIATDGEEAELEGLVTGILSSDNTLFYVNGQLVSVNGDTSFESDSSASSLTIGQPLEVAGVMEGTTLVAAKVELKVLSSQKEELEGVPTAVDASAGTLELLGQTIRVSSSTIFEDDLEDGQDDSQTFNLSSLTPDVDHLTVDLYRTTNGDLVTLEATKVERDELPSEGPGYAEVEGYIQAVGDNQTQITVVNVTVDISDPSLSWFTPVEGERVEIFGFYDTTTGILKADNVDIDSD
ncbi:MAG: DUF5666 domain-containing protein [Chromatiales bacterium]|jgi:hypothetical protein